MTSEHHEHEHDHDDDARHPALKPAEPDHPMMLDGNVIPGDMTLMARCMAEELLQSGLSLAELIAMSADPNYQALFAMREAIGGARLDALFTQAASRVGRYRVRAVEHADTLQPVTLTVRASS